MLRNPRNSAVFETRGERSRAVAFGIVGVVGALIGYLVVLHLKKGPLTHYGLAPYDVWMIVAGALGSMIGLYIAGKHFGQPGWWGFFKALASSIWVSFVSSLVGGTLMLPLYGTMFGPFTLAITLAAQPFFAVLWFANLFGAHLMLTYWQRERDSIFDAFESGRIDAYRQRTEPHSRIR